jgi:hypothetical protein
VCPSSTKASHPPVIELALDTAVQPSKLIASLRADSNHEPAAII